MNELLIVHPSHCLASGVQISTFSELDHVVDVFSDGTGTNQGSFDASVSNSLCSERSKKGLSLVCRLAKLLESLAVRNHTKLGAWSCGLIIDADGTSRERSRRSYNNGVKRNKKKKECKGLIQFVYEAYFFPFPRWASVNSSNVPKAEAPTKSSKNEKSFIIVYLYIFTKLSKPPLYS